ncbi:hypothetical protein MAIC_36500 [Mycolicibacterium aichiense]|uniref:Uncharacterized protein n=1 Tax=Mycolicibacterium aichiense TaxID=1799 RepID=A0AAD1HNP9_9MYCO|nr:hypothetical protein MAIC_36500 [Mycolicibacterium aichiense]
MASTGLGVALTARIRFSVLFGADSGCEPTTPAVDRVVTELLSLPDAISWLGVGAAGSVCTDAATAMDRVCNAGATAGGSPGKCIAAVASTFTAVTVITIVVACAIAPTFRGIRLHRLPRFTTGTVQMVHSIRVIYVTCCAATTDTPPGRLSLDRVRVR